MYLSFNSSCPAVTTGAAPQIFSSAFQFFAAAQCLITEDWPHDAHVNNFEKFDFIIVGAGTAGCVVANRLTEVKNVKVLLIEAGSDPPIESIIPGFADTILGTEYDWQYFTVNTGKTNGANINGNVPWPRGKMLGGCSSINAAFYFKGNDNDYQKWYNDGNKEWHPNITTQYFKKAESLQDQELLKDPIISQNYGHHGPLVINTYNSTYRNLTKDILKSWHELNIKTVRDLNSANVLGSGICRVTAADGQRYSTAKAYLNPVRNRSNLKVIKKSLVTKVLINIHKKAAYGVQVERRGKIMTFLASHEVILSAGAINTPQLLMLSGVGPRKHLRSKNIPCIVDLPAVGQNLQDHLLIPAITIFGDEPGPTDEVKEQFDTIQYLYNRKGYLSHNSFSDIVSFYSTNSSDTYPKFQNYLKIFWKNSSDVRNFFEAKGYYEPIIESIVKKNEKYSLYLFMFEFLHPYSRGNISLKNCDPKEHPLIYANYFDDPKDLQATIDGIKYLTKIINTTYFKSIRGFLGRINWSPCNQFELDSEEYWKCICINMVSTVYHPAGSAKMGPDPESSVVDSRLRVHKMSKLRIIDASVMPYITGVNTNGPTIMIGERASDLIKEDYKFQ